MSKPVIVVFPFPLLSHYLRCASLLRQLRSVYEIVFAGEPALLSRVASMGFGTLEIEQFDPVKVLECSRRFTFEWLAESELMRVLGGQLRAIEQLKPALIISDAAQTARMAAEHSGVAHLSLANSYMTPYFNGTRPLPENHPALKYSEKIPPDFFDLIIRTVERAVMWKVHGAFRRVRRRLGLPRAASYLSEFEGSVTAVVDDCSVFPLKSIPSEYVIVGPAFHQDEAVKNSGCNPRSKIVVTMGSSGSWPEAVVLNESNFHGFEVVVVGSPVGGLKGAHITAVPFCEPSELFADALVCICHGGNGSIYQSLSHGVPVLSRPSMFEQEWNTQFFERAGWIKKMPHECTAAELLSLIDSAGHSEAQWNDIKRAINLDHSRLRFKTLLSDLVPT